MRLIDADALNLLIDANQLLNPKLSVYDVQKIIEGMPTVNPHTDTFDFDNWMECIQEGDK